MQRAIVAAALPSAQAQNWPGKTVRIVVPHTAAAPFDGAIGAEACAPLNRVA